MKAVIFLIFLVFAVFGFSEFLHIAKLFTIFPKRKLYSHIVVNLQNSTAEKQLLYIREQYSWHGSNFADFVVFYADNLDDETYRRCKELADKYGLDFPKRI